MSWCCVHLARVCLLLVGACAAENRITPETGLQDADAWNLVQWEVQIDRGSGDTEEGGQLRSTLRDRLDVEQPPTQSVDPEFLERHGISMNAKGDLDIFASALITNFLILAAFAIFFSFARQIWPQMYANNVRTKLDGGFESAPFTPSNSFLGWIPAGLLISVDEVKECAGLDAALLIEFSGFSMRLLAAIGIPLLVILSPIHCWAGGQDADKLSRLGLNNVEWGKSWLFDIHSVLVWYVVIVTERMVWLEMRRFRHLRYEWLVKLSPPRSTTLLVEGLPSGLRTDDALADYFRRYFTEESVECAYVVKYTHRLKPLFDELNEKKLALEKAVFLQNTRRNRIDEEETMTRQPTLTLELEELERHREDMEREVARLSKEVAQERARIREVANLPLEVESDTDGEEVQVLSKRAQSVCSSSGFVTFSKEKEALLAMNARCSADSEEMILSVPPSPSDIRYDDLQASPALQKMMLFLGYGAIFGIFVGYTPFIALISTLTDIKNLEKITILEKIITRHPTFATLLEGFFSTLAIVLFLGFLPSILMWIFRTFFTLKADAWAQLRLQVSYFWFLVVFVLLITAVGASLTRQLVHVMNNPMDTFRLLAESLPKATHFYLNYLIMQWVVHAMNLSRYFQLGKYFAYRAVVGDQRAVELSEPEDQDYYGMGARSARWSLDLTLAIVFCSITPLMTVVAFLNFLITRVVYGYLVAFAETRKSDIGGSFFVEQMRQVQYGLIIYVVLMTGVFAKRAETWLPAWVAGLSLGFVVFCFKRMDAMVWDTLPVERVLTDSFQSNAMERHRSYAAKGASRARYVQPEMLEEEEWLGMNKQESL